MPLNEIAQRLAITPQTLSAWKKKGAWQERRNAEQLSPKTLYRKLLGQLDALIEKGSPLETADAISKICKQVKELDRSTTLDDTVGSSGIGLLQRARRYIPRQSLCRSSSGCKTSTYSNKSKRAAS